MLPPRLEQHHRTCVGKIQAAIVRLHWDTQHVLRWEIGQHVCRHARRFISENQRIARLKRNLVVAPPRSTTREGKPSTSTERSRTGSPIRMHERRGQVVIVETGATQQLVLQAEPQRLYQMQRCAHVCAQPNCVAGIGSNLRCDKHEVKHRRRRYVVCLASGAKFADVFPTAPVT